MMNPADTIEQRCPGDHVSRASLLKGAFLIQFSWFYQVNNLLRRKAIIAIVKNIFFLFSADIFVFFSRYIGILMIVQGGQR
jgi:hypothetical protein